MGDRQTIKSNIHSPEMMRMINELSRMFGKEMRKVCEENGVPVGYRSLLFHLAHHNGCSQRSLAEMAGLKASTVSIAIDKMERDGYVTKERNPSDIRAVRIYLTEKGLDIDRKNRERINQLEKQFSKTISDSERLTLIMLLDKVIRGYCTMENQPYPFVELTERPKD